MLGSSSGGEVDAMAGPSSGGEVDAMAGPSSEMEVDTNVWPPLGNESDAIAWSSSGSGFGSVCALPEAVSVKSEGGSYPESSDSNGLFISVFKSE